LTESQLANNRHSLSNAATFGREAIGTIPPQKTSTLLRIRCIEAGTTRDSADNPSERRMLYATDHSTIHGIHGIHGIISTDVDATVSILTALPFKSSGQNRLKCALDRSWNVV
jgi:hypothetical protein